MTSREHFNCSQVSSFTNHHQYIIMVIMIIMVIVIMVIMVIIMVTVVIKVFNMCS